MNLVSAIIYVHRWWQRWHAINTRQYAGCSAVQSSLRSNAAGSGISRYQFFIHWCRMQGTWISVNEIFRLVVCHEQGETKALWTKRYRKDAQRSSFWDVLVHRFIGQGTEIPWRILISWVFFVLWANESFSHAQIGLRKRVFKLKFSTSIPSVSNGTPGTKTSIIYYISTYTHAVLPPFVST